MELGGARKGRCGDHGESGGVLARLLFGVVCFCLSLGMLQAQQSPATSLLDSAQSSAPVSAQSPAPAWQVEVIHQESAKKQLQLAAKAHEKSRGRKGPRRLQLLHEAIAHYEAVGRWWPKAKPECAVAAFRRGEIHRSLQESGAARGAFEEVLEVTKPTDDLRVRALLELGHLDRRERRWRDAVLRYRQAAACEQASLRYRNDAREWLVKVHFQTMSWQAAERVATRWMELREGPVEEIRIVDYQIRAQIGARQLRKADLLLEELQQRMRILALAPTAEGARIERALQKMKAPAALELARQNGR